MDQAAGGGESSTKDGGQGGARDGGQGGDLDGSSGGADGGQGGGGRERSSHISRTKRRGCGTPVEEHSCRRSDRLGASRRTPVQSSELRSTCRGLCPWTSRESSECPIDLPTSAAVEAVLR
jgi:hypothetical protein